MPKVYAYKRVSTHTQNLDRQLPEQKADVVFEEKISAGESSRPKLELLLAVLDQGDEVHVHELSRLARSVKDLTEIIQAIITKGSSIHFHKEALDFAPQDKGNSFQSLLLNMLGAIAQFERDLLLERQREGIALAKQKGVYKGRRSRFSDDDIQKIKREFSESKDKAKLARRWKMSRSHLYNIAKR